MSVDFHDRIWIWTPNIFIQEIQWINLEEIFLFSMKFHRVNRIDRRSIFDPILFLDLESKYIYP